MSEPKMKRFIFPKEVVKWIEENGYYMPITQDLYYDVLSDTLYRRYMGPEGEVVKKVGLRPI